ncbi:hypothetical protein LTR78_002786 [Recurvomyces mirabilis]|uniref:J domain-containing protein n=1 Tax=Recurvomyces mirabilis TaxID=574656 RepID=A0AAE0WSK7_9PEZI|nr:hypothetical protein LTR78_002786 [Recurvomyces mirabilis]KAK5159480.1 DnaJ subfamily A member 3, mitochondrial [Recurvomyces mirabilis]
MSNPFALETLRVQVTSDKAIYKSEKERFNRLLSADAEEITEADRKAIINWSRAAITDYSQQLEKMEEIDRPSKEEKQIMQLLNELLMLGDQIAEFTSNFVKEFEEKFGTDEVAAERLGSLEEAAHRADAEVVQKGGVACASGVRAPKSAAQHPTITVTPPAAAAPILGHGLAAEHQSISHVSFISPEAPAEHVDTAQLTANWEDVDDEVDCDAGGEGLFESRDDPEGIYATLGVPPTATMPEIRKAYRDMMKQLHPDRNRDVEDAAARFADFKILYSETLGDEKKRTAYDNIQTADELEQLTRRVKQLTTR